MTDSDLPPLFTAWQGRTLVDATRVVEHATSLRMRTLLARQCGVFAGPSTGMALAAALDVAAEMAEGTLGFLACDGGWKYLSEAAPEGPEPIAVDLQRPQEDW